MMLTPRRLRALVLSLGVISTVGLVLHVVGPNTLGWNPPCARIGVFTNAGLVLVSIGYLALSRWGNLGVRHLIDLGLIYVVLNAFAIALMERAQPHSMGISFVAVLIVLFPLFVPASLGRTMLAAYFSALMPPLAGWVYLTTSGQPLPMLDELPVNYVINFVSATLAIVPALAIRGIYTDVVVRERQLGSYELTGLLGRGGMGEVWHARHQLLHRPAAIKIIHPSRLGSASPEQVRELLQRFEREAQATALLHSPHTILIYDYGTTADATFYYVMELLDGFDMETLVERFGPLDPARVRSLLEQACDSLEDAHQSGLIHRDIKPANIFVCRYGHRADFVKILDFGLVRSSNLDGDRKLTADSAIAGTPGWIAPEVALGEDEIDHRVDIYALGCVAYWLLTGKEVFDVKGRLRMVLAHVHDTPVPPSQRSDVAIPEALERIVLDCLAKDPAERPQSAREVAERLRDVHFDEPWDGTRAAHWWQTNHPQAVQPDPSSLEAAPGEASTAGDARAHGQPSDRGRKERSATRDTPFIGLPVAR